jgi:peptidoglycan/LPS O-acetylase OafA/YrhL
MKIKYRPEIDGLRAIAILSVIFYALPINELDFINLHLSGGYLGVDIFFVISGYLISSMVNYEYSKNKKFNFLNFYVRRIRRLLPGLFFYILIFLPIAYFLFHGSALEDFVNSIIASLFLLSNMYFFIHHVFYFESSFSLKPFLNLWSLSIEEQYYLIFPIIYFLLLTKFKKIKNKILISTLLFSLSLASFANYLGYTSVNFYFLPTRAWEFLVGTLAFEFEKNNIIKKKFNNLLSLIGLLIILLCFFIFNNKTPHPSYLTLIPTFGAFLLIISGKRETFVKKFLSLKIFIFIGLISYSLYLAHHPIFIFANFIKDKFSINFNNLFLCLILFVLSAFSYYFVEKPFRNKNKINNKNLFKITLLILILIFAILYFFIAKNFNYKKTLYGKINIDNGHYAIERQLFLQKYKIFYDVHNVINYEKDIIDKPYAKKILIIGNSHGEDLFTAFKLNKIFFKDFNFAYINLQIHPFSDFLKKFNYNKNLFDDAHTIIIRTKFLEDFTDVSDLKNIIIFLKKHNKEIILFSNTVSYQTNRIHELTLTIVDDFIYKNKRVPSKEEMNILEKEYFKKRLKYVDDNYQIIKPLSEELKIKLINSSDFFCNYVNKSCIFLTYEGKKIQFDYGHLTLDGAKFMGEIIYRNNLLK